MIHNEHQIQRPFAVITECHEALGREIARLFASKGFDLLLTGNNPALRELREELGNRNVFVETHALDTGTFKGVESLLKAIEEFGHPVDAFILTTAHGTQGPFVDTELNDEFALIRRNVLAPIHLMKTILSQMAKRGHGHVLITATKVAEEKAPFEAVQGATQAFLHSFAEAVREEVRQEGVVITSLLPKLDDPVELAIECFDAIMSDRDHVYTESFGMKVQSMIGRFLPERARELLS